MEGTKGTTVTGDIALDDISVTNATSCASMQPFLFQNNLFGNLLRIFYKLKLKYAHIFQKMSSVSGNEGFLFI